MEARNGGSRRILPTPSEVSQRVENWDAIFAKYNKPDESGLSIPVDSEEFRHLTSDESEDDSDDCDGFVEEENSCQQLQVMHPANDRVRLLESLRPQIAELEKLLPPEVLLYDPPNRQQRAGCSRNFSRDPRRFSDSEDSMCSMEQDNYLRKNMGKRRPSHHPSQKIICKKTVIKKYVVVNSQSLHSYRQSMPFYASPSKSSSNRRRPHKFTRNRIITDSETDSSSKGSSRKRWKRGNPSGAASPVIERRQVSPVPDNTVKMRNLSIVLERLKPSEDVSLEKLLKIGREKTAPTTPNPPRQKKQASPKKRTNVVSFKQVTPPRPPVLEKPVVPQPENGKSGVQGLIQAKLPNPPRQKKQASPKKRTKTVSFKQVTPPRPPVLERPVVPQPENVKSGGLIQVTLPRPPVLNEPEKVTKSEPQEVIDISSDTDGGSERTMGNLSFNEYSFVRNEKHRTFLQDTDSDELDIYWDYKKGVLRKDVSLCPAGTKASKSDFPRSTDILVYQGVPEASSDAKITVDRRLLETRLGKELTDSLIGSKNYQKIIPAAVSVYFRPPAQQNNAVAWMSSDDDSYVPVKVGDLRYFDAGGNPY